MAKLTAPKSIFPGTGERGGALLLDLLLLSFVISAIATVVPDIGPFNRMIPLLIFLLYFVGLPLTPLQGTPGKRIVGIKICDRGGRRLDWLASLVRAGAMMCWIALLVFALGSNLPVLSDDSMQTAILMAMFLPWAPVAFLPHRQSLFDLLAGTIVVHYKADEAAIAQEAPSKPSMFQGFVTIVLCLIGGAGLSVAVFANRDHDRLARVVYAVEQTKPLRDKIEEFHGREGRWPKAADLGVAEFTPYPAGGGYRLRPDGSIVISFSVLNELKGHELVQRPVLAAGGEKLQWQCSADAGLSPKYLPYSCRDTAR